MAIWKKINLDFYFAPYIGINSKWISDLNVENESIKVLEENLSEIIFVLGEKKDFLTMTESPDSSRRKTDTFDNIKIKTIFMTKMP